MAAQFQPAIEQLPAAYGAMYLPELMSDRVDRNALLLPLTFVYLLSTHMRFVIPVHAESIPVVESALDEVLAGNSLQSRGVVYQAIGGADEVGTLLRSASLLVATGTGAQHQAWPSDLPQAVLFQEAGKGPNVRLRNIERIADEELKGKLVGCAQLINIQSGGFLSEGHFSLSW